MKKIPSKKDTEVLYHKLHNARHTADALSPLERIVLDYTPASAVEALLFRQRLKRVLAEGKNQQPSKKKLLAFAEKYFHGAEKELAIILLSQAVIEWNSNKEGEPF
jgi:hypothetical protein